MTLDSALPRLLAPDADRGAIAAHLERPDSGWTDDGHGPGGSRAYVHATAVGALGPALVLLPPDDGTCYSDDARRCAEAIHTINATELGLSTSSDPVAVARLVAIVRQHPHSPSARTAAGLEP